MGKKFVYYDESINIKMETVKNLKNQLKMEFNCKVIKKIKDNIKEIEGQIKMYKK